MHLKSYMLFFCKFILHAVNKLIYCIILIESVPLKNMPDPRVELGATCFRSIHALASSAWLQNLNLSEYSVV